MPLPMTNPDVFYNREDLWSVATEVALPPISASKS